MSKQHLVTQDKNENMVQITMLAPRDTPPHHTQRTLLRTERPDDDTAYPHEYRRMSDVNQKKRRRRRGPLGKERLWA